MSKTSEMKCASYIYILTAAILTSLSFVSLLFLTSSSIFASDHVSNVSVTVPVSCNMTSTTDPSHTATINPGQVKADIGTTTFKVFCNDNTGYAIYAIGYSGDEYGNTNMLPTNPTTSTNPSIVTGTATSGDTSNWAMKITPVDGIYKPTIESDTNGSFTNYHIVPDKYTKIATLTTNTDFTIGSSFQSTYRVFVSQVQPADTYTGKVKYTLVHPNDADPPIDPSKVAYLKHVGFGCDNTFAITDELPATFVPDDNNTISTVDSPKLVYYFSSWDYYWDGYRACDSNVCLFTEAVKVYLPSDSSHMFETCEIEEEDWPAGFFDTSLVTDMSYMFHNASLPASVISNLDVSNVTNMRGMFYEEEGWGSSIYGADASTFSNWDTSNVTDMSWMFVNYARPAILTDEVLLGLSNWNTSNVTNMSWMFSNNPLTDISGIADWNVGNVTNFSRMFYDINDIDATVLNSWNVQPTAVKYGMFGNMYTPNTNILPSWCNYLCKEQY